MSEQKTTTYHHGNLREAIIEVSVDILKQEGVDAITMRGIAHRLEVSPSAAYRHFSGKDALIAAIAQQGYQQMSQRLSEVATTEDIPNSQRFQQMGVIYITYAIEHPAIYRLMYGSEAIDPRKNQDLKQASLELASIILMNIKSCQARGYLKQESARDLLQTLWALCHGAAILVIDGHIQTRDIVAFAERTTAHLADGIT